MRRARISVSSRYVALRGNALGTEHWYRLLIAPLNYSTTPLISISFSHEDVGRYDSAESQYNNTTVHRLWCFPNDTHVVRAVNLVLAGDAGVSRWISASMNRIDGVAETAISMSKRFSGHLQSGGRSLPGCMMWSEENYMQYIHIFIFVPFDFPKPGHLLRH